MVKTLSETFQAYCLYHKFSNSTWDLLSNYIADTNLDSNSLYIILYNT